MQIDVLTPLAGKDLIVAARHVRPGKRFMCQPIMETVAPEPIDIENNLSLTVRVLFVIETNTLELSDGNDTIIIH